MLLSFLMAGAASGQILRFKFDPVHLFERSPRAFGLEIEHNFKVHHSITASHSSFYLGHNHSGDGEFFGRKSNIAYRRYFGSEKPLTGFYLSPSLNYNKTTIPEYDEPIVGLKEGSRKGFGIGLYIGQQFIVGNHITLGYDIGHTFYRFHTKSEFYDSTKREEWLNKRFFNINFQIGWLFN